MVVFVIINNKHFMDKNVFGTRELAEIKEYEVQY